MSRCCLSRLVRRPLELSDAGEGWLGRVGWVEKRNPPSRLVLDDAFWSLTSIALHGGFGKFSDIQIQSGTGFRIPSGGWGPVGGIE